MDDEVLEAELRTGLLNMANVCAVATYEAGASSGQRAGRCQWRSFAESMEAFSCADTGARVEMDGDGAPAMHLWKWRKGAFGVQGYVLVPVTVYYSHTILQQMINDSSMLCYHEGL